MTRFYLVICILNFTFVINFVNVIASSGSFIGGLGARLVVFGSFLGCPLCVDVSVKVN